MSRFSVGWAGLLGLALACTGDGIETLDSEPSDTAELVPAENQAPIVITVPVIDAVPGTTVTLAAQAVDADGEVTDTEWAQTGGPDVTLADPESLVATFEAPVPSADLELRFSLTVTDDDGDQAEAVVTVRVEANAQPLLEVAGPAEVSPGDTVTLFAAVTHDFGDPAGIAWAQTAGETVTLTPSASGLSASFEAPSTRYGTDLAFTATATDRFGATATASLPLAVEGTIDGEIRDVLHDVILVDFQTVRPGGYLFTDEPGAGVFKWTRTDTGPALNITSTIARFFGEAG